MNIHQATVHPYTAPLARAYVSATAEHTQRDGLILQLATETGAKGLGEAAPLSNRTEPLHEAHALLSTAADAIRARGHDPQTLYDGLPELDPRLKQAPTARFALEIALLDLLAQDQDVSLAAYLHEHEAETQAPRDHVPVNATIPATTPKDTATQAEQYAHAGYDTIKLKTTGDWHKDKKRIQAAHEVTPDTVTLRLDVNGAWPDTDTALEHLETLQPYNLEYVEQPLPPDAIDAMATLRENTPIPIAADEPLLNPEAAERILEAQAADVLILKPMVLGGARPTLTIAQQAAHHETPIVITSTIDGAIGRAGALHTAATAPGNLRACGLATGSLFATEPAAYDERIHQGRLAVPTTPGTSAWLTDPLEAKP